MNYWDILGLAPTKDLGAIRRAYAAAAAQYNPEDHPEEFLAVRQAYEQAAAYARGQEPSAAAPEWIDPPLPCSEKVVQPERSFGSRRLYASGRVPDGSSFYIPSAGPFYATVSLQTAPRPQAVGSLVYLSGIFSCFSRPLVYEGAA